MDDRNVYVVKDDCCGGCGNVHAVFTQRAWAEAYCSREQPNASHTLLIEEHDLNPYVLLATGGPHLSAG